MNNKESKDLTYPREYSSLNDNEKVNAILGAVMEPVSKQFAIELSGINYEEMEVEPRAIVDSIFTRESMETTQESGVTKYRLGDEEREKLGKRLDMKTVHSAIAENLLKELGFDDILNKKFK